MPTIRYELTGDTSDLIGALRSAEAELGRSGVAATGAQKKIDGIGKASKGTANELGGLKKIAAGLGFGGAAEKAGHLAGGMEAIGASAGIAAGALAVLAAEAYGLYKLGRWAVEAAFDVEELDKQLRSLNGIGGIRAITPEQIEAASELNENMAALWAVYGDVRREVGAQFAPVLEALTEHMLEAVVTAKQLHNAYMDIIDLDFAGALRELAKVEMTGTDNARALADAVDAQATMAGVAQVAIAGLAGAHDGLAGAEQRAALAAKEWAREQEKAAAERAKIAAAMSDLIWAQGNDTIAAGEAIVAAEKARAEEHAALVAAQLEADLAAAQAAADAETAAADAVLLHDQEIAEARATIRDAELASAGALAQGIDDLAQAGAAANAKHAKSWWALHKVAALTSITIDTATAIMRALAELGPVAGGVAAAGITITGGVQAAAVAASSPPTAHTGRAPDERDMRVLESEAVLSPRATREMGRESVQRANAGRKSSASGAAFVLDGREIDTLANRLRTAGSTLLRGRASGYARIYV